MSTNEIGEKIYYSDAFSKVTNMRVTCNHITVPVEKIKSVYVNFRIESFCFSVIVSLSSLTPFLFLGFMPERVKPAILVLELILIAASTLWTIVVYKNYTELVVNVGGRELVIVSTHMRNKDYVCKLSDAIGDAISGENKYQKLKKSGEIDSFATFNPSETFRLKLMLDDYEKLKSMREELLKAKNG